MGSRGARPIYDCSRPPASAQESRWGGTARPTASSGACRRLAPGVVVAVAAVAVTAVTVTVVVVAPAASVGGIAVTVALLESLTVGPDVFEPRTVGRVIAVIAIAIAAVAPGIEAVA